ncbi:monoamine oxidase [Nocardiopsis sp. Huas11]|uniref:flavin monoamine oxidase family protein n=1 Tax=Nocardiopsis sp. Huas11 TaxID=2183912 RepID=UPI000EAF4742|nr:NAD(P)/FAD-dependent oxidoreductase [Nocardiopsis sp. Huas11]RKS09276.1 monoamine oxidase [Nocardiopsis sp. Huas11]
MAERTDVVVVGAGVSGLAAARRLCEGGLEVLLLDGGGEPGGRAALMPPSKPDGLRAGSMYLPPGARALLDLAAELDVAVEPALHDSALADLRVDEDGGVHRSDANVPLGTSWWTRLRNEWIFTGFARKTRTVDLAEPWSSVGAAGLDRCTVRDWLRSYSSDSRLLALVEEALTLDAGLPADRISLLWLLAHIGPDLPEEEDFLRLDPALLVERMAAPLAGLVRTGRHVERVRQDEHGVRVSGPWGEVAADRAVLAVSPADAAHVAFAPALPPERERLQRDWPQAEIIRTDLVYWRPFWRGFGLSGGVHFDDGVPAWTLDDSPVDSTEGRLVAHTYTFGERDPLGADQGIAGAPVRHRALLLENLRVALGPLADDPIALTQSSAGPGTYSRAYQSPTPPGFLTGYGPWLRRPVGRVHWAAAETGVFPGNGTLDGAVSSGHRAAEEVLRES